jgi:hypothetical protein
MEQEESLQCPQEEANGSFPEPEELVETLTQNFTRSIFFPYCDTGKDSTAGIRENEFPDILYIFSRETAANVKQNSKQGTELYLLE